MADLNAKILPLRTSEPARVPDDATMDGLGVPRLDIGEIAINLADKKIYSKNEAGEVVVLGAGADGEEGDGLPGGGFKPIQEVGSLSWDSYSAFDSLATQDNEWFASSGATALAVAAVTSTGDQTALLTALAGNEVTVTDSTGAQFTFTPTSSNADTGGAFGAARVLLEGFGTTNGGAIDTSGGITISSATFDVIDVALVDGDALRYDGEFWRPVKYKLEALDDVTVLRDSSPVSVQWISKVTSTLSGSNSMQPGDCYQDVDNNGLHPTAYVDGELVSIVDEFEDWFQEKSGVDVSTNRNGGDYQGLNFETVLRVDGTNYDVTVTRFRNRANSVSSYDPRLSMHYSRPAAVPDEAGQTVSFPEFDTFYAESKGLPSTTVSEGSVLQYKADTGKWTSGILSFLLQQADDFAYRQEVPVTPSWTSGDSTNPAEYEGAATTWVLNLEAAGGANRSQLFTDNEDATSVWWSSDGTSFTEDDTVTSITQDGTAATITFETAAPTPPATLFIAFSEPGVPTDQPVRSGDLLVFDGTSFVPVDPAGALNLGITDLNDVNTVTNPPTDGQALVWDSANSVWKPGNVASDTEVAMDDLTDVTITSPSSGQVIKYTGSGFENSALDYSEIENAPAAINTLGDISDVDLSLAPVIGQVLVWDGSAWKPEDQSGGGGGGGTVAGALTERADITSGITLAPGVQGNLELQGLGEAGKFVQVTLNVPAWVRFYPTAGARAGDATRQVDEDPTPGSGVLLEVRSETPDQTFLISPGAIYYNNDTLPDQTLYARIQNQGGSEALVNVTVRAYTSTSTDTISGGTFGSG